MDNPYDIYYEDLLGLINNLEIQKFKKKIKNFDTENISIKYEGDTYFIILKKTIKNVLFLKSILFLLEKNSRISLLSINLFEPLNDNVTIDIENDKPFCDFFGFKQLNCKIFICNKETSKLSNIRTQILIIESFNYQISIIVTKEIRIVYKIDYNDYLFLKNKYPRIEFKILI